MKHFLSSLCLASFSALALVSCDMFSGGNSGGTELKNPTVDQMTQLEKEWGVPPREAHSHRYANPNDNLPPGIAPPTGAPQSAPPATAPLPQTPSAAPPVFEQAPQSATPAQIEKLKY
ncbi:MAG TPA: hypothetical protein VGH65_04435 [Verrucomicrobiaceae bacterium]|jgi:hypothetical protein